VPPGGGTILAKAGAAAVQDTSTAVTAVRNAAGRNMRRMVFMVILSLRS
jgi:hypothetical protein